MLRNVSSPTRPVLGHLYHQASSQPPPDEIAASIKIIQEQLISIYGKLPPDEIPILYGGSVNPNNAGALLLIPGVNGVVVGESSLISDNFNEIIETANTSQ